MYCCGLARIRSSSACFSCLCGRNEQEKQAEEDRKSTRLNSSHQIISYAVFCLKKKNTKRGYSEPPITSKSIIDGRYNTFAILTDLMTNCRKLSARRPDSPIVVVRLDHGLLTQY